MKFTIFTCGVFYERFAPGGMKSYQIGTRSPIGGEGEYLMDFRRAVATLLSDNAAGQPVYVCMTSANDVARFVVAALDLRSWPREFRLRGERMTAASIVAIAEQVRGRSRFSETFPFTGPLLNFVFQDENLTRRHSPTRRCKTN